MISSFYGLLKNKQVKIKEKKSIFSPFICV